jgi:hypothetical protein
LRQAPYPTPSWSWRDEERAADGEDAALGDAEVAEPRLLVERAWWPEVLGAEPRPRVVDDPDRQCVRWRRLANASVADGLAATAKVITAAAAIMVVVSAASCSSSS